MNDLKYNNNKERPDLVTIYILSWKLSNLWRGRGGNCPTSIRMLLAAHSL